MSTDFFRPSPRQKKSNVNQTKNLQIIPKKLKQINQPVLVNYSSIYI